MGDLKTDPKLLRSLAAAVKRELTPDQLLRQKISFIMGSLSEDSTITRAKIEKALRKSEGFAA